VGDSPWLPFRLAPNEVQLAIQSLPLAFLPEDPEELFTSLAVSILNTKKVEILSASYLNPNSESSASKSAMSVIVLVNPGYVPVMGYSIRLFSLSRPIQRVYSSNRYTQCRNCRGVGHLTQHCPTPSRVCPLCSLNHTRSNHRCPNPTCPSASNLKATRSCGSSSPACCTNCGGEHSALYKQCTSRPAPPALRRSATAPEVLRLAPADYMIDTATDDENPLPPTSPTGSL